MSHDCYRIEDTGTYPDASCVTLPDYALSCTDIMQFCRQNQQFAGESLFGCQGVVVQTVIDAAIRISPRTIKTDIEIQQTTAISKSQLNFDIWYTNCSCEELGDDETVTPELHTLLFNGKVTGNYSSLLTPLPILAPGASWCDPGFSITVPKTSIKKIAKILDFNLRARSQIKIRGVLDLNSRDWKPFKITECDASLDMYIDPSDQNQDVDPTNGLGGIDPFEGEADGTNNTGNEGFYALSVPNSATDIIGTKLVIPSNAAYSTDGLEVSAADFGPPGPGARVGIFRSLADGTCDPLSPVFGPVALSPLVYNSISGGDHWNAFTFPAFPVAGNEILHVVYFFGPGPLVHGLGIDNYAGVKGEPNAVNYERTYMSLDGDCIEDCPVPGNWIVKLLLDCPPAPVPVPGESTDVAAESFQSWGATVARNWSGS